MRHCLGLLLLTCAGAGAQDLNALLESKVNPDDYAIRQDEFGLRAPNPIQNLDARFRADGVTIAPHRKDDALKTGALVRLRTASWGRADQMRTLEDTPPIAIGVAQPPSAVRSSVGQPSSAVRSDVGQPSSAVPVSSCTAEGGCATSRVEYHRPGLTEWYLNGPSGLEQGFTIAERPAGMGELRVHVQVVGARARLHGDGVRLVSDGGRALSFGKLLAKDAVGRTLPSHLELLNLHSLGLVVDDREAQYPLVIDPTVANDHWQAGFGYGGANSSVNAIAYGGAAVYAGGYFTAIGDRLANRIAKWDGSTWCALGTGLNNTVNAVAVDSDGNVYAGGDFTMAGDASAMYVAKWNPSSSSWSALGTGLNNSVLSLALDGSGNVYAGGWFTTAGGVSANYIAKWAPGASSWSALGAGTNGYVYAIAADGNGNVYAGGSFILAGGAPAGKVAKWTPGSPSGSWSSLGTGLSSTVYALAVDGSGSVYAGGSFTNAGGVSANRIAKWNPGASSWSALGTGMDDQVRALAVDGVGDVYAAGSFGKAGAVNATMVAKWCQCTSSWDALGKGLNGSTYTLALDGSGNVYAGGGFTLAGGGTALSIAKCTQGTASWSTLGTGMDNEVYALAVAAGGKVYVGGSFTTAGGLSAKYIAQWTPATAGWTSLGTGMNGNVNALAVDSSANVYAGGDFTTAGGVSAKYVAEWTPATSAWSALAGGTNSSVYALACDGAGSMYVGGRFTTAGGNPASRIAKWTPGSPSGSWSSLGTGVNATVRALALDGSGSVCVGGEFTTSGGGNVKYAARWTPVTSSWAAMGTEFTYQVASLTVDRKGNIYAGGFWPTGGSTIASSVATWNPATSSWSLLRSFSGGLSPILAADASLNLYVGILYEPCMYMWSPATSTWSELGSGLTGATPNLPCVYALTADADGRVYVGGRYLIAGGQSANYISMWTPGNPTTWRALGTPGGLEGRAYALAVDGSGNVYAGGDFTAAGGVSANYVAKWTPASGTWSGLGTGTNGSVCALTVDGSGNLYVGGDFTTAGGTPVGKIAKWTPGTPSGSWSALGTGTNGGTYALVVNGSGDVYVGGSFTSAGGVPDTKYIAKWTPGTSTWQALGTGMDSTVSALAVDGSGNLYAGGGFSTAGDVAAMRIAQWNPGASTWSSLKTGVNGTVLTLAIDGGGNVYAGGTFLWVGSLSASYMAKWTPGTPDGSWSAVGTGVNQTVYALAVDGSGDVYVGGEFTLAGGISVNRIAKWTPGTLSGTWSPLGTGVAGGLPTTYIGALATSAGGNVFTGGSFTGAGDRASVNFAHFSNQPPINPTPPSVTGTYAVSSVLTCSPGTWTDADGDTIAYSYQWERASDCAGSGTAPISGATSSTYTLASADDQQYVRVAVVADDGASGIALGSTPWLLVGGYEGDVAPCACGGDADVSIADWVQVGRFAAALDTVTTGSEFQKADCAPKETNGDGTVSIADWVQAGRYAAKLDPVQTAGGPSAP